MSLKELIKKDTWVKPYIKQYKGLLVTVLLLGTATIFCGAALMFTSGYTIDKSATHPYNILLIYVPILLTRAFGIGRPVFRYVERIKSHNWVLRVTSNLRTNLYKILEKDASFFSEEHKSGEILGLLSEDINHLQNLFLRTIFPSVIAYLLILFITIGLGYFNIWFGLLILFLLLVETIVIPLISVTAETARKYRQKNIKSNLYTELTDNVLGANDWIISNRKNDFKNLTSNHIKELNASKKQSMSFRRKRNFSLQLVFAISIVIMIIFVNLQFTSSQAKANFVSAFVLGLMALADTIIPISQGFEEWPEYKNSIEHLNNTKNVVTNNYEQETITFSNSLTISINNISFQYSEDSPELITNFSETIKPGEKLAIIGPSGSGKTTILQLLMGDLKPVKGDIFIDGHNILTLQKQRSKLFSVLNQSPFLFNTSISNNVRLGNESATDKEVFEALKKVGLSELIESLPDKYDTLVEESGQRFSGGQRERIALARILLQDAPIVILDEPTVGLDPITENELMNTLFTVLKDKTVIWVTHHLHNINHADKVILLSDTRIEMQGSPKELYQENKHFKELYRLDQGI